MDCVLQLSTAYSSYTWGEKNNNFDKPQSKHNVLLACRNEVYIATWELKNAEIHKFSLYAFYVYAYTEESL